MAWNFREWTKGNVSSLSEKELRARYTRALHNFRRRQKNIARGEFATTELGRQAIQTETYNLVELSTREEIENELMRLEHLQSLKQTSAVGLRSIRSKTVRTLRDNGYDFVNNSNLDSFGAFMETWRAMMGENAGSPTPEELKPYENMINKLDPESVKIEFEEWLEYAEN